MKAIFPALLIHFLSVSLSAVTVEVADAKDGVLLGSYMRVFEDRLGSAQWADVLAGKHDANFERQAKAVPNFGSTRSVIWAVVDISFAAGQSLQTNEYLLELSHPILDYVDVIVQDAQTKATLLSWQTGDLRSFDSRPINHRHFLFPLPHTLSKSVGPPVQSGASELKTETNGFRVYLRLSSDSSMSIPLKIWAKDSFYQIDSYMNLFLGLYYGIIFVMIIYNLITAYAFRSLSGFLYVGYIFFLLLSQTMLDGIFYRLFPSTTFWNNLSITFWGNFSAAFGAAFSVQYLIARKHLPKLSGIILALGVIALIGGALTPFLGYRFGSIVNRVFVGTTGAFLILLAGLWRMRQGYEPARFFVLGYGIFMIAVIIYTLGRFGIISGENFIIYHGMHFGSALEAIILSFGLADRIRLIQKEKELAQATTIEQQRILNAAFARFVPTPFLQILGKKSIPDVMLGDYTEREMTILFADIRGFTTISEKLNPKQTFEFINSYLQGSGPVIRNHAGFIDKYMGDGIMALFETPGDAIRAALRLQERNARLNKSLGNRLVAPLNVGIGIHTGHLMLGTIGEHQRMDGTVISDAVNLASRVESLTKQYGVQILVTKESLANMALGTPEKPWIRRYIDKIAVKGKNEPATLYEVIPIKEGKYQKYAEPWLKQWVAALRTYYDRDFSAAVRIFNELRVTCPSDMATKIFAERCEVYLKDPPPADWQGVAVATNK